MKYTNFLLIEIMHKFEHNNKSGFISKLILSILKTIGNEKFMNRFQNTKNHLGQ